MARTVLSRRARLDLLGLDRPVADAVVEALRTGSHRVICRLAEGDRLVRVVAIRHRSVACRSDPR